MKYKSTLFRRMVLLLGIKFLLALTDTVNRFACGQVLLYFAVIIMPFSIEELGKAASCMRLRQGRSLCVHRKLPFERLYHLVQFVNLMGLLI